MAPLFGAGERWAAAYAQASRWFDEWGFWAILIAGFSPIPYKVFTISAGALGMCRAAILARLVTKVYSSERIEALATQARQRFRQLGYRNIRVQHSDGSCGWPQFKPFDAIIVTAGGAEIPEPLLEQLAIGGRLVMPLGTQGSQTVVWIMCTPSVYERSDLEPVNFVPWLGGAG